MKKILMIALLVFPAGAFPSSAFLIGHVLWSQIESIRINNEGQVTVFFDGLITADQFGTGCRGADMDHAFTIDANTDVGKTMLSVLMEAKAVGLNVVAFGTGRCMTARRKPRRGPRLRARVLGVWFEPRERQIELAPLHGLEGLHLVAIADLRDAARGAREVARTASSPSRHAMSTSKPPRARSPRIEPLAHALRQRRQQLDLAVDTLQQHLGDAVRAAEVAVDLERRVRVEHVRIGARRIEQ